MRVNDSNLALVGESISAALRTVLELCSSTGPGNVPGEGGERAFRGWLSDYVLKGVLGWPSRHVVQGERFDIRLTDDTGQPVCTIETKDPNRAITPRDRHDFEHRLSHYPTLRAAYLTKGDEWERLDLLAPDGHQVVTGRSPWVLGGSSPEATTEFFRAMIAATYDATRGTRWRQPLAAGLSTGLRTFSADLQEHVAGMADWLASHFGAMRTGEFGHHAEAVLLRLFDMWCEQSIIPSRASVTESVSTADASGAALALDELVRRLRAHGFTQAASALVAESVMRMPAARRISTAELANELWPLYGDAVQKYCVQTAHVLLGRALLYRIGEDQDVFPVELSGDPLEARVQHAQASPTGFAAPARTVLEQVRAQHAHFLPAVYLRGPFDWWLVTEHDALPAPERARIRRAEADWDSYLLNLLRMLDSYSFVRVDFDVWRNIYQHYLPSDERQRLGGFYTPDDLVELTLSLVGYVQDAPDLLHKSVIDPACGSGTFVAACLSRLLNLLSNPAGTLADPQDPHAPPWKAAQRALELVSSRITAIDIHPFASFLTTLNVLFSILPAYAVARSNNPDYTLDLMFFAADSLEKHSDEALQPELFEMVNSRVQLAADSLRRYQTTILRRFDFVVGNPPWGGVLKGSLSPLRDPRRKQRLSTEYPHSARGKYDIYGLFIERAVQLLAPDGRFGLVTQDTFLEAGWARELRSYLAEHLTVKYIIDLNPFGNLFFDCMNSPCIIVAENAVCAEEVDCLVVRCARPHEFGSASPDARRQEVVRMVREALGGMGHESRRHRVGFATALRVSHGSLRRSAQGGWHECMQAEEPRPVSSALSAHQLLVSRQGVTVGGPGCQEMFQFSRTAAESLGLEAELVRPAVKGLDVLRWRIADAGVVFLYPYILDEARSQPAFRSSDPRLPDSLEFGVQLDDREREIVQRGGITGQTVASLLAHREALGLVEYPVAARYLAAHYDALERRELKGRNIRTFSRQWYEFAWPRDAMVMTRRPKLISPRLARSMRFALDEDGVVPQDSCICLVTRSAAPAIQRELTDRLGREALDSEVLMYCLAFLNSSYATRQLTAGRAPTPKGSFYVNDAVLRRIPIPPPSQVDVPRILGLVRHLCSETTAGVIQGLEAELAPLVAAGLPVCSAG